MNQSPSTCDDTDNDPVSIGGGISDGDLVRQIAASDESALEALYQRYSAPLYRYLLRLAHEQTAAEDLLQESGSFFFMLPELSINNTILFPAQAL